MSAARRWIGGALLLSGSVGLMAFVLISLPWYAWVCFGLLVVGAFVVAGR